MKMDTTSNGLSFSSSWEFLWGVNSFLTTDLKICNIWGCSKNTYIIGRIIQLKAIPWQKYSSWFSEILWTWLIIFDTFQNSSKFCEIFWNFSTRYWTKNVKFPVNRKASKLINDNTGRHNIFSLKNKKPDYIFLNCFDVMTPNLAEALHEACSFSRCPHLKVRRVLGFGIFEVMLHCELIFLYKTSYGVWNYYSYGSKSSLDCSHPTFLSWDVTIWICSTPWVLTIISQRPVSYRHE